MKKIFGVAAVLSIIALTSGCTGQVYNQSKDCTYDYLFHPAVSVSKIIGGCGPTSK